MQCDITSIGANAIEQCAMLGNALCSQVLTFGRSAGMDPHLLMIKFPMQPHAPQNNGHNTVPRTPQREAQDNITCPVLVMAQSPAQQHVYFSTMPERFEKAEHHFLADERCRGQLGVARKAHQEETVGSQTFTRAWRFGSLCKRELGLGRVWGGLDLCRQTSQISWVLLATPGSSFTGM